MQIRSERLTWQVVGDNLVVLDLDGSMYLKLNGTARLLWERIAEGCDETQLVDVLVAEYEVDAGVAEADVAGFLLDLHERELLESD